jgi:subtilisin family serine protease
VAGACALAFAIPQAAVANDTSSLPDSPALASQASGAASFDFSAESDTGLWVVQLSEPALASYTGGISGLAATSPLATNADRLDVSAPASIAYLDHLMDRQNSVLNQMERALGRSIEVAFEYRNVVNGLAVRVDAAEAARLAALPGVAAVLPDTEHEIETDVSNDLIASASIWDGDTGTDVGSRGEGVVVGMIDTGVNPFHPSFAAVDGDGFAHTNPFGSGNFVGVCDPGHPDHDDICNDKLIGAWNFHPTSPSAQDVNGHGSHVGGTIAGNIHDAVITVGNDEFTRAVQGVAPRANVISYLVCFPSCPQTSSVAAVEQGIADGVDVLNYSISGGDSPWTAIVDLAFLDAFNAGVFVSASAGNAGPGASTVAKTGPWNASVAASTHQRVFGHTVDVIAPGPVPPALQGLAAPPGDGPGVIADIEGEIRYAGQVDPGNGLGCSPFPGGVFEDSIALIQRGQCTFAIKVNNAVAAGADAVVIFNNFAGPPIVPGGLAGTAVPAVMVGLSEGEDLRDFAVANTAEVRINTEAFVFLDEDWEDVMAGFSSRGPSQFEMLAPTYTLPGVNILAAVNAVGGDPVQYGVLQGTSMSSPHGAGAAALLRALHPDWSPAEIRSALAGTADPHVLVKEDGITPADPFDQGSGRVDLDAAARVGLVMDETHANFVAANPAIGGDPKTLNLPAMVNMDCVGECTWTRTVTSVADTTAEYTAVFETPSGMTLSVNPSVFSVAPGASQVLEITADVSGLPSGEWAFGDVRLTTGGAHANGLPIASVHYPVAVIPTPATPSLTLDPTELTSVQGPNEIVTQELLIGNVGGLDLEWSVFAGDDNGEAMPTTITHSASQELMAGNSVACSPDGGASTTDNGYLRHFQLESLGIFSDLDVTEVSFGVESASAHTVTVNLFEMIDPDGPFVYSNFTLIGTADHALSATALEIVTVPVNATVDAGSTLVVEIDSPDLSGTGSFFMGSNNQGQTAPSYLRSASCGLADPIDLAAIGFDNMQIVINVHGLAAPPSCEVPAGTPWVDVAPLSGTVAPDGTQAVEVTFDSTGLEPGTLEANLCLETNDPNNQFVVVPVTLVVEAQPSIIVTPDALAATVFAGGATDETLTIENVGSATLDWVISQAEAEGALAPLGLDPAAFARHVAGPGAPDRSVGAALQGVDGLQGMDGLASVTAAPSQILPLGDVMVTDGLAEGFDDVTLLPGQGWAMINNSDPLGVTDWFQGNTAVFGAHQGADNSYIAANFQNADLIGTISNWLITPELSLGDGDTVSFWTRAPAGSGFPDRLEVRLSTSGDSVDVGSTATSVGDFTTVLLEVNPDLLVGGYPEQWTQFELTLDGIGEATTGRLGFRYFVTDAGPFGFNSDYVGIDTFEYVAADSCNEPVDIPWLGVSPAAGSTAPGGSSDVTVSFDSTGLAPGEYEAQLCVDSNDPVNPRVVVPVTLTVLDAPSCDTTITGTHLGPLVISEGVTCLAEGARVIGPITVHAGAGLVSTGASVIGSIFASGASVVDLSGSRFAGPVSITGSTDLVSIVDNRIVGSLSLTDNNTGATPIVVSGNTIIGSLSCSGNEPPPVNNGVPNIVVGPKSGQCASL